MASKKTAEPKTVDIKLEMSTLGELLEKLAGSIVGKVANVLSEARDELDKAEPSKDVVGRALDQAINYSKKDSTFSEIVDSLEPHVEKAVVWLGSNWLHIINLLRSKELGEKFPIVVVEYDPRWEELYKEEARFLKLQFGPEVIVRTEHFGSTAVPGLASKPVIDILVEVTSFETAKREITPNLEKRKYVYSWRSDIPPGHMMFVKGYGIEGGQKYHLHMTPGDHPLWSCLLFRDYLRKHPETAKCYEKLKHRLAKLYPNDREAYTDGKADFIVSITEKAEQYCSAT